METKENFTAHHVLAAPLVQVLSVSIRISSNDTEKDQVYGKISVTDGNGQSFVLYDRDENNPETVTLLDCGKGNITLNRLLGESAISASDVVKVEISLMSRSHNDATIAQGQIFFNYRAAGYHYETVLSDTVNGQCGSAVISHITYRHAVAAHISVMLECKADCCVIGDIVAKPTGSDLSVSLFNKTENQPLNVQSNATIELSRDVMVVPATSSFLSITSNLWNFDTNERLVPEVDMVHRVYHRRPEIIRLVEGENVRIRVSLTWRHANMALWCSEDLIGLEQYQTVPRPLMEVFSVSVCGKNGQGQSLDIYGSIIGYRRDSGETAETCIFSRDKRSPERLPANQTVTLTTPSKCLGGYHMGLKVNLRDANDSLIMKACLPWYKPSLEHPVPLYNRHLCSVLPGAVGRVGHAAVHYAFFDEGFFAKVEVHLVGESPSAGHQVYGSVFTEYSNYKYNSNYDREYYRSKLFQRQSESPLLLPSTSEVPLTKSVVAVPKGSLLIIDVNLAFVSPQTKDVGQVETIGLSSPVSETFKDRLEFNINQTSCAFELEIPGVRQKVIVKVKGSEAFTESGQPVDLDVMDKEFNQEGKRVLNPETVGDCAVNPKRVKLDAHAPVLPRLTEEPADGASPFKRCCRSAL